jgi:hypothetical protein
MLLVCRVLPAFVRWVASSSLRAASAALQLELALAPKVNGMSPKINAIWVIGRRGASRLPALARRLKCRVSFDPRKSADP